MSSIPSSFRNLGESECMAKQIRFYCLNTFSADEALRVLENLSTKGWKLDTLIEALDTRYGEKYLEHVCRAQLQNYFSKWPEVFATPNQAKTVVQKLVHEIIFRYGVP